MCVWVSIHIYIYIYDFVAYRCIYILDTLFGVSANFGDITARSTYFISYLLKP